MAKVDKTEFKYARKPLVSVIITTKNEERVLGRLLKSISAQGYDYIETVVVDNYSSDKTKEVAKKFTEKVFNFGPERSAQRNFGAKKSEGEYLLFLDADMELPSGVVSECVKAATKNEKIGAIAISETPVAHTFWEKVKAHERSFYNVEGDPLTDAARFFKKEVYEQVGGYDEAITGPEDWDITDTIKRKGYKIGWISVKIKHYERVPNPLSLAKKKYYYGLKAHRYFNKQKISPVGAKTVYFFRPIFYKNWRRLLSHPLLSSAMFIMFTFELFGGGLGYIVGKVKGK